MDREWGKDAYLIYVLRENHYLKGWRWHRIDVYTERTDPVGARREMEVLPKQLVWRQIQPFTVLYGNTLRKHRRLLKILFWLDDKGECIRGYCKANSYLSIRMAGKDRVARRCR